MGLQAPFHHSGPLPSGPKNIWPEPQDPERQPPSPPILYPNPKLSKQTPAERFRSLGGRVWQVTTGQHELGFPEKAKVARMHPSAGPREGVRLAGVWLTPGAVISATQADSKNNSTSLLKRSGDGPSLVTSALTGLRSKSRGLQQAPGVATSGSPTSHCTRAVDGGSYRGHHGLASPCPAVLSLQPLCPIVLPFTSASSHFPPSRAPPRAVVVV